MKGEEQDRLERQLTPQTLAYRRARIQLARKGLAELAKFDLAKLNETQRISADLMEWQLNILAEEEPFLDYRLPLNQMEGVNIGLVETLTVRHPLLTEKDAENYVAALGQAGARMDEAIQESKRIQAKGIIPPKFILEATIKQMRNFTDPAPGENPFVSAFAAKMAAIKTLPASKREELRSQAENIVAKQVYPAWKTAGSGSSGASMGPPNGECRFEGQEMKRPKEQWTLRKARIYLIEMAFACLEGATSDNPRVTAMALALVRRSAAYPGKAEDLPTVAKWV